MKVGISTATFFSKVLTENSFSVIQQCGGETVEVFLTTYFEYEQSFGELLREKIGCMDVFSIHTLNTQFEPQLFNPIERTRKDAEIYFEKVLKVGQMIGAKAYTFHGSTRLKVTSYIDPQVFGKRLHELCLIAKKYGIKLCLENVHWAAFSYPEFFLEVKKYAPEVGACLDIKQARQSGYDWREYLNVMGDRLCNVHISDFISLDKDNTEIKMVGKGEFPFSDLVDELKKIGYNGAVIIEQYAKNYQTFDEIKDSVSYIKKKLEAI